MDEPKIVVDLIRHAESEMNVAAQRAEEEAKEPLFGGRQNEIPLSSAGIAQAQQFGKYAKANDLRPTHVFSSPAKRALQTYAHSAPVAGVNLPAVEDDLLQEFDWGEWTDKRRSLLDEPSTRLDIAMQGRNWHPPGGESFNMVAARLQEMLGKIEAAVDPAADAYVWVYTHRGLIRSYVGTMLGWTYEQIYAVHPPLLSRTRLVKRGSQWEFAFMWQSSI